MISDWLWAPLPDLAMVVVSAVVIYAGVIAATRLAGLRSFAQFSSFDFAMAIAVGSLVSVTLLSPDPPLMQSLVGLASIYALHILLARLRESSSIARFIDNTPILLIRNGEILEENLKTAAVTKQDLRSLLRRENVGRLDHVHAAVLETAGQISIIHSRDVELEIGDWMMQDVTGTEVLEND